MVKNRQKGFTLIELMLAMAIAAGLLGLVFVGQARVRNRSRFTDGMERALSTVASVKSEALSTVPPRNGGGGAYNEVFAGKFVSFLPDSGVMTVVSVTKCSTSSPAYWATIAGDAYCRYNDYTVTLPYGIVVDGNPGGAFPNPCILFTKAEQTAETHAYAYANCLTGIINDTTHIPGSTNIRFRDGAGTYHAVLNYNAANKTAQVNYLD